MEMVIKTFRDIIDRQKDIEKLEEMKKYIEKRIQKLEEREKENEQAPRYVMKAGHEVLEIKPVGKITYQLEKVRCGKPNCEKCPHGPYWYGYKRVSGKLVSFYVGKELPKIVNRKKLL